MQYPYNNQQPPQQPYGSQQPPYGGQQCPYCGRYGRDSQLPESRPHFGFAGYAVGCGFFAMFVPIPILDVVLGILGIVFAALAIKSGVRGLAISALVISIIGTVLAIDFTIDHLTGFSGNGALTLQMLFSR